MRKKGILDGKRVVSSAAVNLMPTSHTYDYQAFEGTVG